MDFFKIIGASESMSKEQVRSCFKSYISSHHPDKSKSTNLEEFRFVIEFFKNWKPKENGSVKRERDPEVFNGQIGEDVHVETIIEFTEAFKGVKKKIHVRSPNSNGFCGECHGTGSSDPSLMIDCMNCSGHGCVISTSSRTAINKEQCVRCSGSGKVPIFECVICKGTGKSETNKIITVFIPPGSFDGTTLKISGSGTPGSPCGDLYIQVRVKSSPIFKKIGDDILTTVKINIRDFILGCEKPILFPDGETRTVEIKSSLTHFKEYGIPGMEKSKFTIRSEVTRPKTIPNELREVLDKIQWE